MMPILIGTESRLSEFARELPCNQEYAGGLEQGLDDEAGPVVAKYQGPVLPHSGVAALDEPARARKLGAEAGAPRDHLGGGGHTPSERQRKPAAHIAPPITPTPFRGSRRIATRYDQTADRFLGFAALSSIRLWIRFGHAT